MDLERVKPPDEFNNGPIRRGDSADLSGDHRRELCILKNVIDRSIGVKAQTININFLYGDGSPVVPTVAPTVDRSFECLRREDEDADAFRARANSEARAADSHGLVILIFGDAPWKEISHAT